jgi:hypothetical protein
MRNHVRHSRSERSQTDFQEGHERDVPLTLLADGPERDPMPGADDLLDADARDAFEEDLGDVVRLFCPDCARPIAVLADEESLPEHALCPTPWNPFGLTVCVGSGRGSSDGAGGAGLAHPAVLPRRRARIAADPGSCPGPRAGPAARGLTTRRGGPGLPPVCGTAVAGRAHAAAAANQAQARAPVGTRPSHPSRHRARPCGGSRP